MSAMISGTMSVMGVFFRLTLKVIATIIEITTLSQQMLTAIKHVADDKFCFHQDGTLAHHACTTVKLEPSR